MTAVIIGTALYLSVCIAIGFIFDLDTMLKVLAFAFLGYLSGALISSGLHDIFYGRNKK